MPEMHLKQLGFTYSACGPFTKSKERFEKFVQTGNTDFIYKIELDKVCFHHDMASSKLKDLAKRTQSDKVWSDKALKIASDPKYDGYQRRLASMVNKFLIKNVVEMVSLLPLQRNMLLNQIINSQMNFIERLWENLRDEKFIHLLDKYFECRSSWFAIIKQIQQRDQVFIVCN